MTVSEAPVKQARAYKFRFYPNPEQENLLRRTMGCVRLVYNKALAMRTEAWYERQERIGYSQTSSLLTGWKKTEELQFLNRSIGHGESNSPCPIDPLVKIDRFFPSSKRCGKCGYVAEKMPLNVRKWTCLECGTSHDRDINAANNILAAGLAVTVCGADIRPESPLIPIPPSVPPFQRGDRGDRGIGQLRKTSLRLSSVTSERSRRGKKQKLRS